MVGVSTFDWIHLYPFWLFNGFTKLYCFEREKLRTFISCHFTILRLMTSFKESKTQRFPSDYTVSNPVFQKRSTLVVVLSDEFSSYFPLTRGEGWGEFLLVDICLRLITPLIFRSWFFSSLRQEWVPKGLGRRTTLLRLRWRTSCVQHCRQPPSPFPPETFPNSLSSYWYGTKVYSVISVVFPTLTVTIWSSSFLDERSLKFRTYIICF